MAPGLADAATLEHDVLDARRGELVAHRQTRLPRAVDGHLDSVHGAQV